jgi:hypothetical protein
MLRTFGSTAHSNCQHNIEATRSIASLRAIQQSQQHGAKAPCGESIMSETISTNAASNVAKASDAKHPIVAKAPTKKILRDVSKQTNTQPKVAWEPIGDGVKAQATIEHVNENNVHALFSCKPDETSKLRYQFDVTYDFTHVARETLVMLAVKTVNIMVQANWRKAPDVEKFDVAKWKHFDVQHDVLATRGNGRTPVDPNVAAVRALIRATNMTEAQALKIIAEHQK